MPHIRRSSVIFALLLASAACNKAPTPVPVSGTASATPTPALTLVATNTISEPEAALLQACEKGDVKTVKDLLDKGVNINARDKDGRRPIIEAAYWQHADIVRLLIERAADVNAKKVDGTTALAFAINLRNKEIEEMLRQAGAKGDPGAAAPVKQDAATSPPEKSR